MRGLLVLSSGEHTVCHQILARPIGQRLHESVQKTHPLTHYWRSTNQSENREVDSSSDRLVSVAEHKPLDIRQRTVGEMLDASVKLMTRNFRTLVPFAAAIVLPFQLISTLVTASVSPSLTETLTKWSEAQQDNPGGALSFPKFTSAQIGALSVSIVLSLLSQYLLQAGLTSFIGQLILDGKVDRKNALRIAARRGPVLLLSSIVFGIICALIIGLSVLSIIVLKGVGVIVMIAAMLTVLWLTLRMSVSNPPIVLETAGPVHALRRSFLLTKGNVWRAFGTLLVGGLLTLFLGNAVNGLISAVLSGLGGDNAAFEFIWAAIAGTISTALTAPISAALIVLLYFDLRVRKEGFDLERLAGDLGRPAPQLRPPDSSLL